jgi:hypothetical protein
MALESASMRGRSVGSLALAGMTAAGALLLAGCSDDGGATVLPPATASRSTTSAMSATPSTVAPTSAETTPTTTLELPDEHVESIETFLDEFFAAYHHAQDTGDFGPFDALYLPQCSGCMEMRDELVGWLADGATVEGADWVILDTTSEQIAGRGLFRVVAYRTAGAIVRDAQRTEIPPVEPQRFGGHMPPGPNPVIEDLAFGSA